MFDPSSYLEVPRFAFTNRHGVSLTCRNCGTPRYCTVANGGESCLCCLTTYSTCDLSQMISIPFPIISTVQAKTAVQGLTLG